MALLEIALHSSPVAHWTLSNLGGGEHTIQYHIFLPLHTIHVVLAARILEWVAISFFSGPHFLSELCNMTHMSWVALKGKAHSFTELGKALHHDKAVSHEGDSFLSATKYTTHQRPQPTLENSIQFIYNMGKHK